MRAVAEHWTPTNESTTPLSGMPVFTNSGIIKAAAPDGDKISVGRIDYEEYDDENFQYIISPFWDIIDGLTAREFQGIPGIKAELRLARYYRVNYTPIFITERTPSKNREDLWELLGEAGLDYYDRFEWLLRTKTRCANDNLVVDRLRPGVQTFRYSKSLQIADIQYGDTIIVDDLKNLATTAPKFTNNLLRLLYSGANICNRDGEMIISAAERTTAILLLSAQVELAKKNRSKVQKTGIEKARNRGVYAGRKPIEVNAAVLEEIAAQLDSKIISVPLAMKRLGLTSRSTFYRKLKAFKAGDLNAGEKGVSL